MSRMQGMSLDERISTLVKLGEYILEFDERLMAHVHRAMVNNPWFTEVNSVYALKSIAEQFLDRAKLKEWAGRYPIDGLPRKIIGLIAAGNIPAVGFHDVLCVFVSGHISQIKLSDRDKFLVPFLVRKLNEIDIRTAEYFDIVDKLSGFEAVIATGSNNSARYFHEYFGAYPNIIRRNKNSIAVLSAGESIEDLERLGDDIFLFFGLGCRSVSHLYVPEGYDFQDFEIALEKYQDVINHSKYKNNYEYHLAIYIINKIAHKALPHLLLVESDQLISPVGCLNYTFYSGDNLEILLSPYASEIQCIVGGPSMHNLPVVPFGLAQKPELWDYADGIDTMDFLVELNTSQ